jgi:hypothetical protein
MSSAAAHHVAKLMNTATLELSPTYAVVALITNSLHGLHLSIGFSKLAACLNLPEQA